MLGGVNSAQLYIFTQQFASMIASRINLVTALSNLARETPNRRLRLVIEDVTGQLYSGADLADAMEDHGRVFGRIYISVVRSGMNSGRLGDALEHLTTYLKRTDELTKKVRSAVVYPAFVTLSFVAVFNVMVFMILPRFGAMYESLGRELPPATRMMMDLGDAYIANWPYIFGAIFIVIASFTIWLASADGRAVWDELKLRIPVCGEIWRIAALSRLLRTFAVQLSNRIPAVQALRLAAFAASNSYLTQRALHISERVESGSTLADAVRGEPVFGSVVVQMVATGEEAGTLDDLLLSAANYFDTILLQRINALMALLNPALTAIVGCGIAVMLIAAFLPVFELAGNTG